LLEHIKAGTLVPVLGGEVDYESGFRTKFLIEAELLQIKSLFKKYELPEPTAYRLRDFGDLEWKIAYLKREGIQTLFIEQSSQKEASRGLFLGANKDVLVFQSKGLALADIDLKAPLSKYLGRSKRILHLHSNLHEKYYYEKGKAKKAFKRLFKMIGSKDGLGYTLPRRGNLKTINFDELQSNPSLLPKRSLNTFQKEYIEHLDKLLRDGILEKLPDGRIITHLFNPHILDELEVTGKPTDIFKTYQNYTYLRNILTNLQKRVDVNKKRKAIRVKNRMPLD
jgi:hypothetical protein